MANSPQLKRTDLHENTKARKRLLAAGLGRWAHDMSYALGENISDFGAGVNHLRNAAYLPAVPLNPTYTTCATCWAAAR